MQRGASHQPLRDVGRLQGPALGREMGRKIACDRHENIPPLASIAPDGKLPDTGFEDLIGMKARVFAQHRKSKRRDQRLG